MSLYKLKHIIKYVYCANKSMQYTYMVTCIGYKIHVVMVAWFWFSPRNFCQILRSLTGVPTLQNHIQQLYT